MSISGAYRIRLFNTKTGEEAVTQMLIGTRKEVLALARVFCPRADGWIVTHNNTVAKDQLRFLDLNRAADFQPGDKAVMVNPYSS